MKGFKEQNDMMCFDTELLAIDTIIYDAAAATDAGDFSGALVLLKSALNKLKNAKALINAASELESLENTIAEMGELLSEVRPN